MRQRILITGGNGMLGRTLQQRLARHELAILDLPGADITQFAQVRYAMQAFCPDVVIHGAAMTQVDACESERERAFAVNATGSEHVARAAAACGARLIAISTDYVFDGALDRPYREDDPPHPRTVYGASKLAGERAVQRDCPNHTILRTAWLYGEQGPSFVHTMLKLGADHAAPPLKVVHDQRGNPTSTTCVAEVIERLLARPIPGVVHATCEGDASWYELACEIFRLRRLPRPLQPCATADYPRPAPRPANSRLEKAVLHEAGFPPMPDWRKALADFLERDNTMELA